MTAKRQPADDTQAKRELPADTQAVREPAMNTEAIREATEDTQAVRDEPRWLTKQYTIPICPIHKLPMLNLGGTKKLKGDPTKVVRHFHCRLRGICDEKRQMIGDR